MTARNRQRQGEGKKDRRKSKQDCLPTLAKLSDVNSDGAVHGGSTSVPNPCGPGTVRSSGVPQSHPLADHARTAGGPQNVTRGRRERLIREAVDTAPGLTREQVRAVAQLLGLKGGGRRPRPPPRVNPIIPDHIRDRRSHNGYEIALYESTGWRLRANNAKRRPAAGRPAPEPPQAAITARLDAGAHSVRRNTLAREATRKSRLYLRYEAKNSSITSFNS
jgi:hypothetical protein